MLMLPDKCGHSWPHETECATSDAQICINKIKVTAALKSSAHEKPWFDVSVQNSENLYTGLNINISTGRMLIRFVNHLMIYHLGKTC